MSVATANDLLSTAAVRSQAARVTEHVRAGNGIFRVDDSKLDACADLVADVTQTRYPDLSVPYHSRWRHFHVPGSALAEELDAELAGVAPVEVARAGVDLVIPSVLLDAGAGPDWTFRPRGTAQPTGRSEGLGLASLQMFLDGAFSSDPAAPCRTDGPALAAIDASALSAAFQVNGDNPLLGVDGRVGVLSALGNVVCQRTDWFPSKRLGELVDTVLTGNRADRSDSESANRSIPGAGPLAPGQSAQPHGSDSVRVDNLFAVVLDLLEPIWPDRVTLDGRRLGDAWYYEPFGEGPSAVIPFHKLSQWLTYSLCETFLRSGIEVIGVETLTGLPEYRNGGLLLESGVLVLDDPALTDHAHRPESQLIVEWRALTVTLLDEIANRVRVRLDRPDMTLAEILEGGTWAAGRQLAFARTPAGTPPLKLDSDGTLF